MEALIIILSFLILLELSNIVDAKFCAFELNGEPKYYACPRNEYCCNFGCCVSPAFQFYQLWYYWLLVIFMFLLCSGGGWWYRYWLQSRYRTGPGSALPIAGPSLQQSRLTARTAGTQARRTSRGRVARVSYNPARDTVVLHRIWKGPCSTIQRNCPPPSYSSAQAELSAGVSSNTSPRHNGSSHPPMLHPTATSLFPLPGHVPHSSTGITDGQECPYYQLYGPPPSYDSVISELGGATSVNRQVDDIDLRTTASQETCPMETNDTADNTMVVRNSPNLVVPEGTNLEYPNENTCTERRIELPYIHNAYRSPTTNDTDASRQGQNACEGTESNLSSVQKLLPS